MVQSAFLFSAIVGAGLLSLSKSVDAYSGRMTWFTSESTMCGESGFDNSDYIVAINRPDWSDSCHKYICISYGGKSARAKVIDQCATCPSGAIDGSQGLFSHFASIDAGVLNGVQWDYCDESGGGGSEGGSGGAGTTTTSAARTSTVEPSPSPSSSSTTTRSASATSTIATTTSAAPTESSAAIPSSAEQAGELEPSYPAVEDRRACYNDGSNSGTIGRRDSDVFADVPILARAFSGYPMSEEDIRKRGLTPGVDELLEKRLRKRANGEL